MTASGEDWNLSAIQFAHINADEPRVKDSGQELLVFHLTLSDQPDFCEQLVSNEAASAYGLDNVTAVIVSVGVVGDLPLDGTVVPSASFESVLFGDDPPIGDVAMDVAYIQKVGGEGTAIARAEIRTYDVPIVELKVRQSEAEWPARGKVSAKLRGDYSDRSRFDTDINSDGVDDFRSIDVDLSGRFDGTTLCDK